MPERRCFLGSQPNIHRQVAPMPNRLARWGTSRVCLAAPRWKITSNHIENRFQMLATRYCSAVVETTVNVNTPDGDTFETKKQFVELRSFAEVVAHLQAVRDQKMTQIADSIANGQAERDDYVNIGGFTCELHNALGGVVEFALSTNDSLMMRKEPKPFTWYRNGPDSDDILVFYIDGGHHTEFSRRELATRDHGLEKLERWIDTLLGLVLVSVVAVGIRLLLMQTIQRRRERENRQINERLRTLIASYKILGGSFTGELSVDPAHLRSLRLASSNVSLGIEPTEGTTEIESTLEPATSERRRRIRDSVEAALSDVILLGTEEHVNLAAHAAREMVAGNKVHLSELIVSLRNFIRKALDLEPISTELLIPHQGPLRPTVSSGKGNSGGRGEGSDKESGGRSGSGMAMGAGGLGGMAVGYENAASEGVPDEHHTDSPRP